MEPLANGDTDEEIEVWYQQYQSTDSVMMTAAHGRKCAHMNNGQFETLYIRTKYSI